MIWKVLLVVPPKYLLNTLNLQILEFFCINIMGLSLEVVWPLADYIPLWTYLWELERKIIFSVGFFSIIGTWKIWDQAKQPSIKPPQTWLLAALYN